MNHINTILDLAHCLELEATTTGVYPDEPTPDMESALALAKRLPVNVRELWKWYRIYDLETFEVFVEMMLDCQNYADKEGMGFEVVALQRLGEYLDAKLNPR